MAAKRKRKADPLNKAAGTAMSGWSKTPDAMNWMRYDGRTIFCWIPPDQMRNLGHVGTFFALELEPSAPGTKLPGIPVSGFAVPLWRKGNAPKERSRGRG
jgi:hypothetical protein